MYEIADTPPLIVDTPLGLITAQRYGTYDEFPGTTVFINGRQVVTVEYTNTYEQLHACIWQNDYDNDPVAEYVYPDLAGLECLGGWEQARKDIEVNTPLGEIAVKAYGTYEEFPGVTVFINSHQVVTVEYSNTYDRLSLSVWQNDYDNDPVDTFAYPDLEQRQE